MFKKIFFGLGSIATIATPLTIIACSHEGETKCNDGTFSDSKGKGACSHHKGVKTWNYHEDSN